MGKPASKEELGQRFPPVSNKTQIETRDIYGRINLSNSFAIDDYPKFHPEDKMQIFGIMNVRYLVTLHISSDIRQDGGTYKVPMLISWNLFLIHEKTLC